jgi:dipeptidyl-peptidase III
MSTTFRIALVTIAFACSAIHCKRPSRNEDSGTAEKVEVESRSYAARRGGDWRAVRSSTKSPSLVEVVEETAVLRVEVTGFSDLTARERLFAYWMSQAIIAGDEIVYDQRGPFNLAVKELVEEILAHAAGVAPADLAAFRTYAKQVWVNKGIYDAWSYEKRAPSFPPATLEALLSRAVEAGAKLNRFQVNDQASLKKQWPQIQRVIFDRSYQPRSVDKSPPQGEDILSASSNTYYEGLRLRDLAGFAGKYPTNSRLVKRGGRVVELPYRSGGEGVAPGLYAEQIGRIRRALSRAIEVADPAIKAELQHLDELLRTGEAETRRQYEREWLKGEPAVHTVLGFIEVYGDPRGEKGEYEGLVLLRDERATKLMRALADSAAYFEQKLPWDDRWKKPAEEAIPPKAYAVQVLTGAGRTGLVMPDGMSLPNDPSIRQQFGSKNFYLSNVVSARRSLGFESLIREFTYDPADLGDAESCSGPMWDAHLALHEITGHGSGKTSIADWRASLREYGSTIEEARADVVALYLAWDPRAIEIGLVPEERCVEIHATNYVQAFPLALRMVREGDDIERDHLRAQSLIVQYAKERGAIEVIQSQRKYFLVVSDFGRWRHALETLLGELMRIKGVGDYDAAKQLVQKYGTKIVPEWREDALRRLEALQLPVRQAYLTPRLAPIRNESGQVIDARVVEGLGLEETALLDAGYKVF